MKLTPYFSSELLGKMMPKCPKDKLEEYHKHLHQWMLHFKINTWQRVSMLLAQIGLESGDLRWWKEWDSGKDNYQEYDFRKDLGHNAVGIGAKYCGRGPIQTTGLLNYTQAGMHAYASGLVPDPEHYVDNPHLLETPEHGFFCSLLYWHTRNLNQYADVMAFDKVSFVVNVNPWRSRYDETYRARAIALARINACTERRDKFFWVAEILLEAQEGSSADETNCMV